MFYVILVMIGGTPIFTIIDSSWFYLKFKRYVMSKPSNKGGWSGFLHKITMGWFKAEDMCQWEINEAFENPKFPLNYTFASINKTALVCAFWGSMVPLTFILAAVQIILDV